MEHNLLEAGGLEADPGRVCRCNVKNGAGWKRTQGGSADVTYKMGRARGGSEKVT